jgi:hypothetical protein
MRDSIPGSDGAEAKATIDRLRRAPLSGAFVDLRHRLLSHCSLKPQNRGLLVIKPVHAHPAFDEAKGAFVAYRAARTELIRLGVIRSERSVPGGLR